MSARREELTRRLSEGSELRDGPLDTPCLVWTKGDSGTGRGGGYGRISIDGQMCAAHRVAWMNVHGFLPAKKQLDHLCENRACINPAHLEPTTNRQNNRRKGRHS